MTHGTRKYGSSRNCRGSILIYVLWMLALITGLAAQLATSSHTLALNQSAAAQQLKRRMQIESGIQYAQFHLQKGDWQDRRLELFLNDQLIRIEIYNESGFISIYDPDSPDLQSAFRRLGLEAEILAALRAMVDEEQIRFNCFDELMRIDGIDSDRKFGLARLFSIYHEDAINPLQSPADVLMLVDGIDQYRVQALADAVDTAERSRLRGELLGIVSSRETQFSEDNSEYFRLRLWVDGDRYRVIVKSDSRESQFKTLLVELEQGDPTGMQDRSRPKS